MARFASRSTPPHQRARIALVAVLLWSAIMASGAAGAVPGDSSGPDQYLPSVPDAAGQKPAPGQPGARSTGGGDSRLPSSTLRRLRAAGPDGRVLERLAASAAAGSGGSPGGGAGGSPSSPGASAGAATPGAPSTAGRPGSALRSAVAGASSGGSGTLLAVVLPLAGAALALMVLLARRRRDDGSG